ncbi:hypothetical protein C0992_006883 [Termitomyces sp. T32_za158]|nr:hypothetical protein C0992_006883 [Termitomyces sp. T32_za158]
MESLFSQITPVLEQLGPAANGVLQGALNGTVTPGPEQNNSALSAIREMVPQAASPEPSTPIIKSEDDVSESFGQLALDEYGAMRWIGGSSTMSLIQSFRALTSSPLHRISPMEEDPNAPGPSINKIYFPASVFFGKVQVLPGPEEVEFPERDLADKLIAAYFARFHFLMPVLDKPTFLRQYNLIMDNLKDHTLIRSQTAFLSVVFAVFSCAAHLVQDSRLTSGQPTDDGGMGMVYYERALILQYISHPHTQIAHVQCFILMSSFLCSVNCLPQAWIVLGQAVRTGQDLGLHRSPRKLLITSIEKETRKKVWWGVYTLDRMLALALGRPLGINDSDCDVEQPVEVDDDHLPEYFNGATMPQPRPSLMAGSVALNHLYEIGGRVLRQVYALDICRDQLEPEKKAELQHTVETLDNELTKWCEDLPAVFKSQSETDQQVSMGAVLCSHYYSILTTLHRNLLPVKRDHPQLVTAKSTNKAVSSARACIRLAPNVKHMVPPSHHLAFFIQNVFSSAVILLLYAMHAPGASAAAMEEARSSLAALESWEGQWPGARKCKELLVELTETATQAISRPGKGSSPPATVPSSSAVPPSPTSTLSQRRRSVTIVANAPGSTGPGRIVKGRSNRRNQSRDTSTSRRMAAVSPYRVDSGSRARSASRRRPDDDVDSTGRPYYQTFSGSAAGAGASPHSSPSSANLPSPSMSVIEQTAEAASPSSSQAPSFKYSSASVAAQPSPPRFEYGLQSSPLTQSNPSPWPGNEDQLPTGLDMYVGGDSALYSNMYGYPSLDYPAFDSGDSNVGGLTVTSPSSTHFAATGLPFRGLEYIRNFNSGGYSVNDQDSLWHSYDPGAFGFDPDLPFTLSDNPLDLTNNMTNNNH